MGPLIVSFFTEGTGYEQEAAGLAETLVEHDLDFEFTAVPNTGSWVKNCALKPGVIRASLERHDRPVVWLDADARVLRPLDLFDDPGFEFAVRRRDNRPELEKGWGPWQSGTLYFHPTAIMLLDRWVELATANPSTIDQITLHTAWEEIGEPEPFLLPWSYCTIFDEVGRPEDPHVLHRQASRRLRATLPSAANGRR